MSGAEGETRTPTGILRLDPEPSASTSSATSALRAFYLKDIDLTFKVIYIFKFIFVVKDIVERSRKLKWSSFKT